MTSALMAALIRPHQARVTHRDLHPWPPRRSDRGERVTPKEEEERVRPPWPYSDPTRFISWSPMWCILYKGGRGSRTHKYTWTHRTRGVSQPGANQVARWSAAVHSSTGSSFSLSFTFSIFLSFSPLLKPAWLLSKMRHFTDLWVIALRRHKPLPLVM